MDRGRRATLEERIAIVKYTLTIATIIEKPLSILMFRIHKSIHGYENIDNTAWKVWWITVADPSKAKSALYI
ncbi:hypothetical protein P4B09_10020 [Lactiplantibacillus plantarum]